MALAILAIPDAVALLVCAVAAVIDVRRYRVPNWLTASALGAGLVTNAALGWIALGPAGGGQQLLAALGGAALGLFGFGILGAIGAVGMGDVKLVAALGALIRWPLALPMLLYAVLAGGLLALAYALRRRRRGAVARNLTRLGAATQERGLHRMPFALGCASAIASRYLPALGLL